MAGLQTLSFAALALLTGLPLPVYDLIDFLLAYDAKGLSVDWLLLMGNSHIIALPRLLLAADLWLTGGNILSLIITALLARLLALAMLAWMLWRHIETTPAWRTLGVAILAMTFCRAFTLESIVFPNGYNYDLMLLAAVAGMTVVAAIPANRHDGLPWLAGFAALSASLCLANGLLLFPILASLTYLRRRRPGVLMPFLVCGALAAAIYLSSSRTGSMVLPTDAAAVLDTLLNITGSPWIIGYAPLGYAVSGLLLLASLAAIGWCLPRLTRLDSLGYLALMLLLFGLASMLAVAIGRAPLGPQAGHPGRYGLFVSLIVAGLTLLGIRHQAFLPSWLLRAIPLSVLAGALLLTGHQWLQGWAYWRVHEEAAADAALIRAGQRDPAIFRHIHPNPDTARRSLDMLAQRRLYGLGAE